MKKIHYNYAKEMLTIRYLYIRHFYIVSKSTVSNDCLGQISLK